MSETKITVKLDASGAFFASLLTITFIILKLTHYIDWSWWWVLSPLWIGVAITLIVLFIFFIIALLIK